MENEANITVKANDDSDQFTKPEISLGVAYSYKIKCKQAIPTIKNQAILVVIFAQRTDSGMSVLKKFILGILHCKRIKCRTQLLYT